MIFVESQMTNKIKSNSVFTIIKSRSFDGFIFGLRQPSLVVNIKAVRLVDNFWIQEFNTCFHQKILTLFPKCNVTPAQIQNKNQFAPIVFWMSVFVRELNLPIFEETRLFLSKDNLECTCVLPTLKKTQGKMMIVLSWIVDIANDFALGVIKEDKLQLFNKAFKILQSMQVLSSNTPHLLKTAFKLGIQIDQLENGVFQFGQSTHSRWLDSSFTDETPQISAGFARDKTSTLSLLGEIGLPVPLHARVKTSKKACDLAEKFKYPVVIKATNLDGGVGVFAGLNSPNDVMRAFKEVEKRTKNIAIEKHFKGKDYRLTIFNGRLLWAIERRPAGVVGDGFHTISELIDKINLDSRRGVGPHAPLKKIVLDDEMLYFLKSYSYTPQSIPSRDQFVPLIGKSNVTSGGTPIPVTDFVHPDNANLAIRAAEALRLDLAGIDLMIPDINLSWRESGAVILEVNAQPQLGSVTSLHLYPIILNSLLGNTDGRVPIVLVIDSNPDLNFERISKECQLNKDLKFGFFSEILNPKNSTQNQQTNAYSMGKNFLRDRAVGAIVIQINSTNLIETGLPFDRFDLLIVNGDLRGKLNIFLSSFARACLNKIYIAKDIGLDFVHYKKLLRRGVTLEYFDSKLINHIIVKHIQSKKVQI